MGFSFSDFADALKGGATISAGDVLAVRHEVWPDGSVSDAEAEEVFALNRLARDPCPEWSDFFVEAMCEHVVNGKAPHGFVDDQGAAWLIDQIDRDGAAPGAVEIALVVKILETALNCPASLKTWALGRIEAAILKDGVIGEAEVALLRRIVFACGGDGALIVSEAEADMLWRLKDACRDADNAPGWKSLFVQAVGNHLMAFSSYRPLERGEAERLDAFVADRRSSVLGFFGRMGASHGAGAAEGLRATFGHEETAAEHDAAVDGARAIAPDESAWLQARIDADGARDPLEEALLAFIAEESGQRPQA